MDGNPGLGSEGNGNGGGEAQEMPVSVKIALEKAKEYTKNKGVVDDSRSEALSGIVWENVEIKFICFTYLFWIFFFQFLLDSTMGNNTKVLGFLCSVSFSANWENTSHEPGGCIIQLSAYFCFFGSPSLNN